MNKLNVEIKAHCRDPEAARAALGRVGAVLKGVDRQADTYFGCAEGRLKLRQGHIENSLIHYVREDRAGPKASHVTLAEVTAGAEVRAVLAQALGVRAVVRKVRDIWYLGEVKLHVDEVEGLGSFVEIEAGDLAECERLMKELGVTPADLLERSYGDMVGG